ncbi:MAG: DUF4249 domain-containing protein [Bacteroidota bacterium]
MMKGKKNKAIGYVGILITILISCVEDFDTLNSTTNFLSILVVDARITDRAEVQSIILSRTFEFDSVPIPERNAQVSLVAESGSIYPFSEEVSGIYSSISSLNLSPGESYQLQIITQAGVQYASSFEKLPEPIEIGKMQAVKRTNAKGVEGVAIVFDNKLETSSPEFFRYGFEETYKIVAPDYVGLEWDEVDYDYLMNDEDGWEVTVKPREERARVCYATNTRDFPLLASTEALDSPGLEDFEIRFLSQDNYMISHRYSILVKQYHHSADANSFYSTLLNFSSFDNVLSNVQTGLIESNIKALNSDASVLGYFELSSYSEKRMFVNYVDLFPDEALPPYIISCDLFFRPELYPPGFHWTVINGMVVLDGVSNSPLIEGILSGQFGYFDQNSTYGDIIDLETGERDRAPFITKSLGCVDCRKFGSNVMPEFWEE